MAIPSTDNDLLNIPNMVISRACPRALSSIKFYGSNSSAQAVIPTPPSWVTTPRNRILRNRNRKLLLPSSSSVLRHDPRQSIRGCLIWPIIAVARSSNNLSQGVLPTKSDLLLRALNYVSTQQKTDHKHFCTNFSQCPTPRVNGTDPINHISGPFSDSSTPEWQSRRLLVEVA